MARVLRVLALAALLVAQSVAIAVPRAAGGGMDADCGCCAPPPAAATPDCCCCDVPADEESSAPGCGCAAAPDQESSSAVLATPPATTDDPEHVRTPLPTTLAGANVVLLRSAVGRSLRSHAHAPPPDPGPPRHVRFERFLI